MHQGKREADFRGNNELAHLTAVFLMGIAVFVLTMGRGIVYDTIPGGNLGCWL